MTRASHQSHSYFCIANVAKDCQIHVYHKRANFLINQGKPLTCHKCGDAIAKNRKFTVAPMNKSNYYLVYNPDMLKQLNPKRTT
jgi:hypothetical protein